MQNKLLTLTIAFVLSGCVSTKEHQTTINSIVDNQQQVIVSNTETQRVMFANEMPDAHWWQSFDDNLLYMLVAEAQENNKTLSQAFSNLEAARAAARGIGFDRFPRLSANGSRSRHRLSENVANMQGLGLQSNFNQVDMSIDAGWELDLFGRVSQRINVAEAVSEAFIADYQDLQITVAAEVASTYMELRGAQLRFDIAMRNAGNQQTTLDLTNSLVEAGVGNDLDKARAQTQLSLTRASLPQRQADIQTAIYRLSVLTGKPPLALEQLLQKTSTLPSLPAVVNLGEQEKVLQMRPDVRRAERRLAAAIARYNVATKDFWPEFSLNGSLGFAATNFAELDQSNSIVSVLGLNFRWNGLDVGRVNANIDQRDALANAALADYEQTVLLAMEEIQRSVTEFSEQEQTRAQLLDAVKAASVATSFARQRFHAGESDFLVVLDAERVQLQAEDALAQSEISSALQLVRLYKSLGTGWSIDV